MTTQNIIMSAGQLNLTLTDAASSTETFENFTQGEITNGENGWRVAGSHDQTVIMDDDSNMAFRMSSDPASGDFGGPYSPDLGVAAGESTTTAAGDTHLLSFDFKSASPMADNSRLEVDFGNESGTDRNNFLVIENYAGGIRIAVTQPDANGDFPVGNLAPNDYTTLVDGLDPTIKHHIDMKLVYVDGANNDKIEIFVDGQSVGFTSTFENYRDALGGTHADNAEANQTNSIFFRASANGATQDGPGGMNKGFIFDNITNTITQQADVTGNALGNTIVGNSADNIINAMGGSDNVDGGAGDDTAIFQGSLAGYTAVRGAGDALTFTHTGDNVQDTVSHVEHFNFAGSNIDVLLGGNNADVLGNLGVDLMFGGTGNDVYMVDNVADKPSELANGGTDTVKSTVAFTLGANVENLTLLGSGNIAGTGNNLNNVITGNAGANVLKGGAGIDHIVGGAGSDTLYGGASTDGLTGGAGADRFVFDSPLSIANRDNITDFSHADDAIFLNHAIFTKFAGGPMHGISAANFHQGATAADANDYLNYHQASGQLFYDSNGNGAGGSTLIATLSNHVAINATDFYII